MMTRILSIFGILSISGICLGEETSKPEPPKITHENLYQMEELVKQGADPNAHYFLYPGLP